MKFGLPPAERREARRLAKKLHRLRKKGITRHRQAVLWLNGRNSEPHQWAMAHLWDVAATYTAIDRAPWQVKHLVQRDDFNLTICQGVEYNLITP